MKSRFPKAFAAAALLAVLLAGCSGTKETKAQNDAQLAGQIQARLNSDPVLSANQRSSVGVRVQNGVATLSGWVTTDSELTAALNAAQGVEGVKQVVSRLQVGQEFAQMPAAAPAYDQAPEQAERLYTKQEALNMAAASQRATARKPAPSRPAVTYKRASYETQNNAPATPAVSTSGPSTAANMTPYPANGMASSSNEYPASTREVAAPVPAPIQRVSIPAGTEVPVRLIDSLSSETTNPDQIWRGTVNGDVYVDDQVVIPSGAEVEGRVVAVNKSTHYTGAAQLTLALNKVTFGGKSYSVSSDQWTRKGAARGGNTAKKVGTGAAVGAVLGGIVGGGTGAAIGAAAGAGAGAGANTVTKGEKVELDSESLILFHLASSVTVTPSATHERGYGNRYTEQQRRYVPPPASEEPSDRPVLKRRG